MPRVSLFTGTAQATARVLALTAPAPALALTAPAPALALTAPTPALALLLTPVSKHIAVRALPPTRVSLPSLARGRSKEEWSSCTRFM